MYDCLLYELVINLIKFTMIKSTFVLYFVFAEIVFKMYHFNLISIFFLYKTGTTDSTGISEWLSLNTR